MVSIINAGTVIIIYGFNVFALVYSKKMIG